MNLVASFLYAVASAVLIALGLGFRGGGLTPDSAAFALGGGALVGLVAWVCGRRDPHRLERPRGWGWVSVVLYALFALRAFLWLIWRQGNELRVLSPNNLGDMSLHLTFIEYFRTGTPFWPDSPIFAGGKLAYSAGMDVFNALLALVGMDVVPSLVWVGLVGAILTGIALWRWGGAFTLMGFLCMGGLLSLAAFAQHDAPFFQDYPGQLKFDWAWKSLPLALFVTQRGFLFALPAGLLLLSSWRSRFFGGGDGWRLPFLGELLLYASMPFFHIHTFLVLSFLLAAFFLSHVGARWKITALVAAALVPATVLVWLTTGMSQANPLPMWGNMSEVENPPPRPTSKVLGWESGWMVNEPFASEEGDLWQRATQGRASALEPHGRFLFFWLGNFGLWPFVAGALALGLLRPLVRRKIPSAWAWWAALAFVLVAPLLGQPGISQGVSLAQYLFRQGRDPVTVYILPTTAAISAVICVILFVRRAPSLPEGAEQDTRLPERSGIFRRPTWRDFLFISVGLILVDGALVAIYQRFPMVPIVTFDVLPPLLLDLIFLCLLAFLAKRWKAPMWPAAFVFPALFLFFLCCHVKFAPWAWDNTKLMIWSALIVMPFLWDSLIIRWRWTARAATCFGLFFSGFVSLVGGLDGHQHGYVIADLAGLDSVRAATSKIPRSEPFACAPIWNHPLLLTGRKVALGYVGHLQSHGLAYEGREGKLNTLMNGGDEWRLAAAELGVCYLWWGPEEEQHWPGSRQSWRKGVQVIESGPWGELFDLELPRVPLE